MLKNYVGKVQNKIKNAKQTFLFSFYRGLQLYCYFSPLIIKKVWATVDRTFHPRLPFCTLLYPPLSSCTLLYPPVPSCTLLYPLVPSCTFLYLAVPSFILLYPPIPSCTLLYPTVPSCTLLYLIVPSCTRKLKIPHKVRRGLALIMITCIILNLIAVTILFFTYILILSCLKMIYR